MQRDHVAAAFIRRHFYVVSTGFYFLPILLCDKRLPVKIICMNLLPAESAETVHEILLPAKSGQEVESWGQP